MRDQILQYLPEACPWQASVLWFDSIDSTNTQAKKLAAAGAPHGTVLIADHQTAGRGRLGHSFLSPEGSGIYMSVILRPNCRPAQLMHLTCATAVAMCDAVESAAGFRPGIKWINDLVFQGRKLAGILTELGFRSDGSVDYAVVGIGINCNQRAGDFAPEIRDMAGSLAMFTGAPIDRAALAAAMIVSLQRMSEGLLSCKEAIMDRYRAGCITLGKEVCVIRPGGDVRHGLAAELDDDGGLMVRYDSGVSETVNFGEVSVRGMYGYV